MGAVDHALQAVTGSPALADVLEVRIQQVTRWGHTAESDAARPLRQFLVDLRCMAHAAEEDGQFNMGLDRQRRRVVKLAAMALATIDRIDAETAKKLEQSQ